jgi:hypothetical protein
VTQTQKRESGGVRVGGNDEFQNKETKNELQPAAAFALFGELVLSY